MDSTLRASTEEILELLVGRGKACVVGCNTEAPREIHCLKVYEVWELQGHGHLQDMQNLSKDFAQELLCSSFKPFPLVLLLHALLKMEMERRRYIQGHLNISEFQESQQEVRDQRKPWPHCFGTVHQEVTHSTKVLEPLGTVCQLVSRTALTDGRCI